MDLVRFKVQLRLDGGLGAQIDKFVMEVYVWVQIWDIGAAYSKCILVYILYEVQNQILTPRHNNLSMNRQTSSSPGPHSFEIRSGRHHPLMTWSKNTQLRFQSKLYTYTPQLLQKIRKGQPLELPEKTEPDDLQVLETDDLPKKIENVEKIPQEEQQVELESPLMGEEKKKEVEEDNKSYEPNKGEETVDPKDLSPLKVTKTRDPMLRRTCMKEGSESSEWTVERKRSKKKKKRQIRKKEVRKTKKQPKMKGAKIAIKLSEQE